MLAWRGVKKSEVGRMANNVYLFTSLPLLKILLDKKKNIWYKNKENYV